METELLPNLFRTEYRKIVSVLCYLFGIEHIETAEDIVSDTFLSATETWSLGGIPANPTAWLYTVAKNKTKNYLKRNSLFENSISEEIRHTTDGTTEMDIDLSVKNIQDSQLAMIFTVCNPVISAESQVALALNLLCGFGIQEIADAYLTNKEVIYKRINRAKDKLKESGLEIKQPAEKEISSRLDTVLTTLYLLFSEGYYSTSHHTQLRKDVCWEAMRLCFLLIENNTTNLPAVNALYSLMCFHASRFDARVSENNEVILYDDQDETRWHQDLIRTGQYYLNKAATGAALSTYHLEAGIAYWHTQKNDSIEKWDNILQLYNQLLILRYSPIAALNRTFALSKVKGNTAAIAEAEKLKLDTYAFYHTLLGKLYTDLNIRSALAHYHTALSLTSSAADRQLITKHISRLSAKVKPSH